MKAVVLHAYGPPSYLKYEDFADPTAGPGEVLVRVLAAGVNPIDWKIRSGATASRFTTTFPAILGYDFAGTVQALGEGVTGFAAGDRVFGRTDNCYAELTTVKASELAKVPEGLDLTVAGALGSVGRIALYAAIESGVKVIAGVRKQEIPEALALGATAAIDITDDAALSSLGTVDGVAGILAGPIANKLLGHIKPGGAYGSTVGPPSDAALHPTIKINAFGSHPDAKAMLHYAEAIRDGKLKFPVDCLLPLASAAEAHTRGEKGGVGKIVLTA